MSDGQRADLRNLLRESDDSSLRVSLSAEDLETLLRLRDAGLIDLDGIEMPRQDSRLIEWTYDDFLKHMVVKQGLRATRMDGRDSTAKCRVRYIKYLENHDVVPVQLRPPDRESWLEHVHYRVEEEEVGGTALNQYRKALKSLLKFLDVTMWPCLKNSFDEVEPHWTLPPEELVPDFWIRTDLHDDPYMAATLAHMFHYGFHVGVRPPSEIWSLNLEDVDFAAHRITVTEVKKGGRRRDVDDVAPFIMTAPNAKSLKNYVDHVRPRVDTGKSNAFFLNRQGRRFDVNVLGRELSQAGKRVWPKFTPYTMRRYFATHFLMANDFNVYVTADRLGDTVATVEKHYLDKAQARSGMLGKFGMKRIRRDLS